MIRRNQPWSAEEDNRLWALIERGSSKTLIAAKLKRSVGAIIGRAALTRVSFKLIRGGLKVKAK